MEKVYSEEEDIPSEFTKIMDAQKQRLIAFKTKHNKSVVSPFEI